MFVEMGCMNDLLVIYLINGVYSFGIVFFIFLEFIYKYIDFQVFNCILSEENIMNIIKEMVFKFWVFVVEFINILFSVFVFFIILLYVVFILFDYEFIVEGWLYLFLGKYCIFVFNLVNDIQDGMNCYFCG